MFYLDKSAEELKALYDETIKKYREYVKQRLSLDMSRGKPCTEQLDLSLPMMDALDSSSDYKLISGTDARNYGGLEGIPEMRELFAELFGLKPGDVIVRDSSSLNLMYDLVQFALQFGVGGYAPWKDSKIKFLCPAPGYDRHFGICGAFGIEMITVPMTDKGPDMNLVEFLVASDKNIKGIWCVPKYSNPQGITYSDEVVERLAKMKTAAPDFRIFWDNAYCVHYLFDSDDSLKNLITECAAAGNPDRTYMFASTSKITFAGAGVAAVMSSENNVAELLSHMKYQTISSNKVNQLMHFRFLKSKEHIMELMAKHAEILRPKFEIVLNTLEREFEHSDICSWIKPRGGYFVSVNVLKGTAKRVVQLAKEAGVVFTGAGATYPNGQDDSGSNIRIAPSFPSTADLTVAIEVFCCVTKLAALEKLIG